MYDVIRFNCSSVCTLEVSIFLGLLIVSSITMRSASVTAMQLYMNHYEIEWTQSHNRILWEGHEESPECVLGRQLVAIQQRGCQQYFRSIESIRWLLGISELVFKFTHFGSSLGCKVSLSWFITPSVNQNYQNIRNFWLLLVKVTNLNNCNVLIV